MIYKVDISRAFRHFIIYIDLLGFIHDKLYLVGSLLFGFLCCLLILFLRDVATL